MPPTFAGCETCNEYGVRRMAVIYPAVKRIAAKHNIHHTYLAALFFSAVHARHLAGKAI